MYNLEFELSQPLPDSWSQVLLVSAPSGARSDMVIGWIGSLKNYSHPVYWRIIPQSGKNDVKKNWVLLFGSIDINSTAQLESAGSQLLDFVSARRDPDKPRLLAKSHMSVAVLEKIFSNQLWEHFFVINIIPQDPESIATVQWENFAKTYTRTSDIDEKFWSYFIPNQCEITQPGFLSQDDREKLLQGDERTQFRCIELMYNTYITGNLPNRQWALPDVLSKPSAYSVLDYKTVMTDQGCHMIGDLLGITLTPPDIERWRHILKATRSPDFIDFVGHRWHRPGPTQI